MSECLSIPFRRVKRSVNVLQDRLDLGCRGLRGRASRRETRPAVNVHPLLAAVAEDPGGGGRGANLTGGWQAAGQPGDGRGKRLPGGQNPAPPLIQCTQNHATERGVARGQARDPTEKVEILVLHGRDQRQARDRFRALAGSGSGLE